MEQETSEKVARAAYARVVAVPTYVNGREVRVGDEVYYDKWPDCTLTVQALLLMSNPCHQWTVRLYCVENGGTVLCPTEGAVLTSARLGDRMTRRGLLAEFASRWSAACADIDGEERSKLLDEYAEALAKVGGSK